jgi:uroporphyrinogen decarboxylase
MQKSPFITDITPDWEGFMKCLRREGTPARAHYIELIIDGEVKEEIITRYGLEDDLDRADPYFCYRRQIALQSFLGYDYITCPDGLGEALDTGFAHNNLVTSDTAELKRERGRSFVDEHTGPIANWQDFENYHWPEAKNFNTRALEWCQKNLPENMCMIGFTGSIYENLSWLMGYEPLCYALFEQRDLVTAITQRVIDIYRAEVEVLLQFDRVKVIWGSDDLGFKTGTLISPKDLRELVLPGHKVLAKQAHDAGRPYLMHCCGNLTRIMEDLIEDVKIDGKHSFEDVIEDVCEDKRRFGDRLSLLGGVDVDFLCRATENQIRQRVDNTLEACLPGGGYFLGTGNTVANYIPLENYLTMLDEGRKFSL